MKCILADAQTKHYPESYLVNGRPQANPETPDRVDMLLNGALAAGLERVTPHEYGLGPVARVHTPEYLGFLQNAYARWTKIPGAASEVTPNVHPTSRDCDYPASVVAQAGYHMADAAAPISAVTWESSLWSAWSAVHASELVIAGDDAAYALSRPPGHHAGADIAGGFCYLNNTAIAAQNLLRKFESVAVLDVDLHHGNGTQTIFFERSDVLTVSLHADPVRFYPFFWGHASERGEGRGRGYNMNIPLPRGSRDEVFLKHLATAQNRISAFAPDALVIALGLDAYEGDPIAGLAISTDGFRAIGSSIATHFSLPTVIVQEGGYPCEELGQNLSAFLQGFMGPDS